VEKEKKVEKNLNPRLRGCLNRDEKKTEMKREGKTPNLVLHSTQGVVTETVRQRGKRHGGGAENKC